jgi:hypothetical protein
MIQKKNKKNGGFLTQFVGMFFNQFSNGFLCADAEAYRVASVAVVL